MVMTKNIRNLTIFLILLLITSCAVGPDFQKPEVEAPVDYEYSKVLQVDSSYADSLINLQWWKLFNDPLLDTLVHVALQDNKNILIAASRMEQARASLGYVKADIYPRLDIEAGASRGKYGRKHAVREYCKSILYCPGIKLGDRFLG